MNEGLVLITIQKAQVKTVTKRTVQQTKKGGKLHENHAVYPFGFMCGYSQKAVDIT